MSMRRTLAGCVVLMCLTVLLVGRTDGHITFLSPKEMLTFMQEKGSKKDMEPRSEDGQFEEFTVQQLPEPEHGGNTEKTVEIAVRLSPKQLDHVVPVLHKIVEDH